MSSKKVTRAGKGTDIELESGSCFLAGRWTSRAPVKMLVLNGTTIRGLCRRMSNAIFSASRMHASWTSLPASFLLGTTSTRSEYSIVRCPRRVQSAVSTSLSSVFMIASTLNCSTPCPFNASRTLSISF